MSTLSAPYAYPAVRRSEGTESFQSDKNGSVEIPTPYAWLEEPPSTSKETLAFVTEQGALTRTYLDTNQDSTKFAAELTKNWNYARFSLPALKSDGHYYYTYNTGLQAQASIYRIKADKILDKIVDSSAVGELFFDPNLLSADGSVSRSASSFSEDGRYYAYALSQSGSDWVQIYVRETCSPHLASQVGDEGRLESDVLKFPDRQEHGENSAGTETNADINASLFYHRVGTCQSEDLLVMGPDIKNPEYMYGASCTECGRYVVMTTSKDTGRSNLLWIADLQDSPIGENMKWQKVVDNFGEYYGDIANDGSLFYFYTNADHSSNYKISTYDLSRPEAGFKDLVKHDPNSLLSSAHVASRDKLCLLYSVDVKDSLYLHSLSTGARIEQIDEGLIGSIAQISGRRKDDEMFFEKTGFTSPGTSYRVDFTQPGPTTPTLFRTISVAGISPDDFLTQQVFFKSKDGTAIPMFLTSLKDVARDGTAPVLQYGYGGFSVSMDPFFSPSLLTWIKHYRGVLAVVNLRGGGEYGEAWHLQGVKGKKQNVFDDFIYASKYLIKEKIGAADKIAISGGSNGGLLVAAVANQAPELYAACIADVGVMDMLRFDRFTIGRAWKSDYGDPAVPADFDYLHSYSPLENVPFPSDLSSPYPPIMLLTGDHDDRVSPLHSFKLIAQIQHRLPNNLNPALLRLDFAAGHGAGKSTAAKIKEATDKYGFVSQSMKLTWTD